MRIPTREQHISMNLGQAVAVCLYELVRQGRAAGPSREKTQCAKADELERLTALLLQALRDSGYTKASAAATEVKLRRLIRRLDLNVTDTEVLLGMLRQIAWKLRR